MEMKFGFLAMLARLMKFNTGVGVAGDSECYINNVATRSWYRGMGVGTRLMPDQYNYTKINFSIFIRC